MDSLRSRVNATIARDLANTHGNIDLSYAYGLNTVFIDTSRSIGSILTTSGNFSTSVLGLPINFSFNYSTLRVPLGTNNFFRFSLDKDRLVEQQKQKIAGSLANIEKQQELLKGKQAELNGMMGYVELYLDALKRRAEREARKRKGTMQDKATGITDSLQTAKGQSISLDNPIDFQKEYDSVMRIYAQLSRLKNSYDSISAKLATSKDLMGSKFGQLKGTDVAGKAVGKVPFLQSLRTLDVGLTYPKTTALSGQNVPMKGLHIEIQHRNYYLSVATGLTLNNVMLSTNEVQNKLNYSQNVFNNFDFQQMKNNGWLTALKTGYGTVEGTHAFIGFNYLTNTRFLAPAGTTAAQPAYDPAASVELDLRYVPVFLKGSAFDLVYGKTSKNKHLDTTSGSGTFQSLFSAYPSNLLLGKYTQSVSKLRSEFTLTYRRLDAFANTTTFGTMQPNNERVEIKTTHRISRFLKVGLLYRKDATLRAISGMDKLHLNVVGANASGSYTSYLSYSLFFNYVHLSIQVPALPTAQQGHNYLFGFNLNSNYGAGSAKASSMLSYNDYLLTDSAKVDKYTQFGLMQTFMERTYSVSASYDYFFRRLDGLSTGTSVFGLMGKYALKKVKFGAGLKLASDFSGANSLGGHLEAQWAMNRFLDLGLRAERFVLGDFYRNYYRTQYEQFPYLITFQTRFKI
ncbi:hypothetical protein [Fluviicola sp.]|uniref:hypothetical protein n=1 Tax=Fluviicola sp. TaxID=1917219 RepID=UPI0031D25FDE